MYPHIFEKIRNSVWAITPGGMEGIRDALDLAVRGSAVPQADLRPPQSPETMAAAGLEPVMAENGDQLPYYAIGQTAVVPCFGIIGKHLSLMESLCGGLSVDAIVDRASQAVDDERFAEVVLWWNSPGGTATGVPEAADAIARLSARKPIYSYTDGQMCSAAYWIGCRAAGVFSSRSAHVGSIGVYIAWLDYSENLAREGIRLELFRAGEFKAMGHPAKALTAEERQMLQEDVDQSYGEFTAAVFEGRGSVAEETMQGQSFKGLRAVQLNLVDATYDTLADMAADLTAARAVDTASVV